MDIVRNIQPVKAEHLKKKIYIYKETRLRQIQMKDVFECDKCGRKVSKRPPPRTS